MDEKNYCDGLGDNNIQVIINVLLTVKMACTLGEKTTFSQCLNIDMWR